MPLPLGIRNVGPVYSARKQIYKQVYYTQISWYVL